MAPQEMSGRSDRGQHSSFPRAGITATKRNAKHNRKEAQPQLNYDLKGENQQHQANGHMPNGSKQHQAEPMTSKSGRSNASSALLEDTASLEQKVLHLASERVRLQEQEEYYKGVLAQRSEVHKLREELAIALQKAEAFKEYHDSTKAHLDRRHEELERLYDQAKGKFARHVDHIRELEGRVGSQEALIADKEKTCQEHRAAFESLGQDLRDSQHAHEQAQVEAGGLTEKLRAADDAINRLQSENYSLQSRAAQLQDNLRAEAELRRQSYDQGLASGMQEYEERLQSLAMEASQIRESNYHLHNQLEALRAPRAPLLEEATLLDRIDGIVPVGAAAALRLDQGLVDSIARLVWPNDWGIHYAKQYGSIPDFLAAHADRYLQRVDGAFFRPEPRLRFGSAPLDFPSPAKRVMTLEERTVGPPGPAAARPVDSLLKAAAEPKPIFMYPQIPAPPPSLLSTRHQTPAASSAQPPAASAQRSAPAPAAAAQRSPAAPQPQPSAAAAQMPGPLPERPAAGTALSAAVTPFNPQVMAKLTGKPPPASLGSSAAPPVHQQSSQRAGAAKVGASQDTAGREEPRQQQAAPSSRPQDWPSAGPEGQQAPAKPRGLPQAKSSEQALRRSGGDNVVEVPRRAVPHNRPSSTPKASEGPPPGTQPAKADMAQANGQAGQRGKNAQQPAQKVADVSGNATNSRSSSTEHTPPPASNGTAGPAGKPGGGPMSPWKVPPKGEKGKQNGSRRADGRDVSGRPPGLDGGDARADADKPQNQPGNQLVWQERREGRSDRDNRDASSKASGKKDEANAPEWNEVLRKPGGRRRNADAPAKDPLGGDSSGGKQIKGVEPPPGWTAEADKESAAGKSKKKRGGARRGTAKEAGS